MNRSKDGEWCYSRSGYGYSFEHDLICEFSYIRIVDSEASNIEQDRIKNYEFFSYECMN
jgi:hypothetical protein